MKSRERSLDLLRGLVMVFMIIDHTQEYQAGPGKGLITDPMDLAVTPGVIFFFRWLSHFCAPAFTMLMGISAYLSASRKEPGEASRHLLVRGVLLLVMELTVMNWAWTFNPLWHRYFFQIIGALGVSMIVLAGAVHVPRAAVAGAGLALVALHNLFDAVRFEAGSAAHCIWSFLHQKNVLALWAGYEIRTTYPVIPVVGLALCGYAMGKWWTENRGPIARTGLVLTALFVMLRWTNFYGDAAPFVPGPDGLRSFVNVTKYPMSFQFICMTIGPALLFLAWARERTSPVLEQLGRTAMFFYIAHLVLLHLLAVGAGLLLGEPIDLAHRFGGIPDGVHFPAWATAPLALLVTAMLYPLCRWYEPRRWRYL